VTGRVTLHGIWNFKHHRAGWIDYVVARTKVTTGSLAAKWHGNGVAALNSCLHPHHATGSSISFQRRNSCRVRGNELRGIGVIPVADDDSIIAEADRRQVCGCKFSISVSARSDSVLNKRRSPWIVCLEQGKVVRRRLTESERVLNGVASKLRAPGISRPTLRQSRCYQQATTLRGGPDVLVVSCEGFVTVTKRVGDSTGG
jgi:hypothetical protein